MKYGLFDYIYGKNKYLMGVNFGDEIQSIAASYFLPHIDCFVDRENIRNANIGSEPVKLIMNGWYMHDQDQFPPCKGIIPLFVSMCVADGKDKFIKHLYENREYLCKYGPIGTRDKFTLNVMDKMGVPAYYSGCLTLTLPKKDYVVKRDYVLCIDVDDKVLNRIKKNTSKKSIHYKSRI